MTSETLLLIVGVVMSLLASYIPGFNTWFAKLEDTVKKLIMLAVLFAACATIVLLSCYNLLPTITCDKASIQNYPYR
jgi:hypothetical protein